jgi:hypothetical protein
MDRMAHRNKPWGVLVDKPILSRKPDTSDLTLFLGANTRMRWTSETYRSLDESNERFASEFCVGT